MNQRNKIAMVMTFLTLALFFSGIFVFITPLPFIYYHLKYKGQETYSVAWPSIIVVVAIYMFGVDFFQRLYEQYPSSAWLVPIPVIELIKFFTHSTVQIIGITYFGVYLVMGYLISRALKSQQKKAFKILTLSVIGVFVFAGLLAIALIYPHVDSIVASYSQYVETGMQQFIAAQEKAGLALDQMVYLKSSISTIIDYSFYMLPFILFLSICMLFVLNLIIAKRFFAFSIKGIRQINLSEFKIPFVLVWVVVGLSVLIIVNEKIFEVSGIYYTSLNLLLSVGIAYFLQGLAVCMHFMDRRKIFGLMRLLFYFIIVFMMQTSVILLIILGFVDNWVDLRKLDKTVKKKEAKM